MATAREFHFSGTPYETPSNKTQAAGFTVANIAEVESNNKAVKSVLRAPDVLPGFGRYSISRRIDFGGAQTAAATNMIVASFIWFPTRIICAIRKVTCGYAIGTVTTNLAGHAMFQLVRCRNYAQQQAGTTDLRAGGLGANMGMLSGRQQDPFVEIDEQGTWGTPVDTTRRSGDTNPVGIACGAVKGATAGQTPIPNINIYEAKPGEQPMILSANMGLDLLLTAPAATTAMNPVVQYGFVWDELIPDAYQA
jgi:hypothetical protein